MPVDVYFHNCCICGSCVVHIGVGSALLVSTEWAMRRPRGVERVIGQFSRHFFYGDIDGLRRGTPFKQE